MLPPPFVEKAAQRRFFETSMAPLRLRRGQGAMQGNPCYARLFADLPYMPPNPMKASVGAKPSAASGGRSEAEAQ